MAITKLKHIQSIKKTIEYICKPSKTTFVGKINKISKTNFTQEYFSGDYTTPELVEEFLNKDEDYRSFRLITGINCFGNTEEKLIKEFYDIKKEFHIDPDEKRPAYHGVQSFKGYEIDPIVCHEIGYEFAMRMWGDQYQVVVSTHVNTENVHNHFVVNPTSIIDGKKYRNSKADIKRMRDLSDLLCLEYGISVIPQKNVYSKDRTLPYVDAKEKEFRNTAKVTIRDLIKFDIDRAIRNSRDETDFYYFMKDLGYEFKEGMHNKLKPPYSENFFRFDKLDKTSKLYLEENIAIRIDVSNYEKQHNLIPTKIFIGKKKPKKKLKGIQKEYVRLMYRLGIFPKQRKKGEPLSKVNLKALKDLRDMRLENTYLVNKGISTVRQLKATHEDIEAKIKALELKRKKLYYDKSKALIGKPISEEDREAINQEINRINTELKSLRDENKIVNRRLKRYEEKLPNGKLQTNETKTTTKQVEKAQSLEEEQGR